MSSIREEAGGLVEAFKRTPRGGPRPRIKENILGWPMETLRVRLEYSDMSCKGARSKETFCVYPGARPARPEPMSARPYRFKLPHIAKHRFIREPTAHPPGPPTAALLKGSEGPFLLWKGQRLKFDRLRSLGGR